MTLLPLRRPVTVSAREDEQGLPLFACPMCHTTASRTLEAIHAGADWRCVRCGQHWNANRLAAAAAYAAWVVDRAANEERHRLSSDAAANHPGGVR